MFLFFNLFFARKTLYTFKKITNPEHLSLLYTINDVSFYEMDKGDTEFYFYQNIPYIIEEVAKLDKILFEDLGEFYSFDKVIIDGKEYKYNHSYVTNDNYFQVFSMGLFSKEYFYVTFKGASGPLSYLKANNILELSGNVFLRVLNSYKVIGYIINKKKYE